MRPPKANTNEKEQCDSRFAFVQIVQIVAMLLWAHPAPVPTSTLSPSCKSAMQNLRVGVGPRCDANKIKIRNHLRKNNYFTLFKSKDEQKQFKLKLIQICYYRR